MVAIQYNITIIALLCSKINFMSKHKIKKDTVIKLHKKGIS